jgi:hypothetical protein
VDAFEGFGDEALTPRSEVPFAAQSRDEPDPYSLPPEDDEGRAEAR